MDRRKQSWSCQTSQETRPAKHRSLQIKDGGEKDRQSHLQVEDLRYIDYRDNEDNNNLDSRGNEIPEVMRLNNRLLR
jgi:hypothetical protein